MQDKIDLGSGAVENILPSAPRTLTQAQIYNLLKNIENTNLKIENQLQKQCQEFIAEFIDLKCYLI